MSLRGGAPALLRRRCDASDFSLGGQGRWDFSSGGRQLVFATTPADVDFFDAGAIRHYVFTADYNAKQKVVLAAYGKQEVVKEALPYERPDFPEARFDASGKNLVVIEGWVPHMMDDPCGSWVSIWNIAKRKRVFDGRQLIENSAPKAGDILRQMCWFSAPALSPDGNDIVCRGTYREGDYEDENSKEVTRVVHFDLRRKKAELLPEADSQLSQVAGFFWHPTQKQFLSASPISVTNSASHLFSFDLKTRQTTQLTSGALGDFSPQWSLDGEQIYWIRGSVHAKKSGANRIWRANADGSGARPVLSQVVGATQIQLLSHIANWGRYRDIAIQSLAGPDK